LPMSRLHIRGPTKPARPFCRFDPASRSPDLFFGFDPSEHTHDLPLAEAFSSSACRRQRFDPLPAEPAPIPKDRVWHRSCRISRGPKAPAALMGFTLRSFLLAKGIGRFPALKHPRTISAAAQECPKAFVTS
jgi:hypothetical protein